jgi:RNA-directed DNA polymerase
MQREESPAMPTGLERIAAKARCEPKLRFTSIAHHLTKERVWGNLCQIPTNSAPGVDGQTVPEAKESFREWIAAMLQSVHRQGYQAPSIRRVYIPKPGKQEKRPLGVPCVADRALQRSAAQVLSAIYEQLPQSNASRSLCVLRHCRELSGTATGPSSRGAILAQNAEQPELERGDLVDAFPAD